MIVIRIEDPEGLGLVVIRAVVFRVAIGKEDDAGQESNRKGLPKSKI